MSLKKFLDERSNIRKLPLPESLIQRFLDGLWSMEYSKVLHNTLKIQRPVRIDGNPITFFHRNDLKVLYREIFIGLCYYFKSDVSSPYIIDCGSNIGISILFFKMLYPDSVVTAFEPDERTFDALTANIEGNRIPGVTLHRMALSDLEGETTFYNNPSWEGALTMSLLPERGSSGAQTVQTTTLSRFITKHVDFLKLDIEGAEVSVLRELEAAGSLPLIKRMMIEYHHHIEGDKDRLSEFLGILERNGFGYQLQSHTRWPPVECSFQDIAIYAYQK